jgi:class 3 adenylate cyclase/DNA-binding CsgD family transcriptional regulator
MVSGALLTIVFVDIERSTELMVERGDVNGQASFGAILDTARESIEPYDGREVKSLGDGLMLVFPAPRQAVNYAVAVQRALRGRTPALRIGINTGEVVGPVDDPVGEAVSAAARIADKAEGGEVLVSDVVRQLVGTVPGVHFADRGRSRLKGFAARWRLFAASPTELAPEPVATFGREPELSVVAEVLEQLRHGTTGTLLLEGEAGIGKTHLANVAQARARGAGVRVIAVGADELEHDQPGRMIVALARERGLEVDALLGDTDQLGGTRGFALTEAVGNSIENLAATGPVLVVAEDLQWTDDLSARGLATLSRRTATLPVAILVTLRPTPRSRVVDQLVEALHARGARHVRLGGLDNASVTALAAQVVGVPPGPRLSARLDGAAGNPLYVTEYLRASEEEAALLVRGGVAEMRDDELPVGVRDAILRRLSALPPESLEMLRLASLLGREFTLRDVATIAGRPVVNVAADLRAPVDAAVLTGEGDTLSFRHDLVRDAVYDNIASAIRRDLHAAAGRALASACAPVRKVARQMELGARPGDTETVEWLVRAAEETMSLDVASAVTLYERALAIADPEWTGRTQLEIALVEPLAAAGRVDDAYALARSLLTRALDPRAEFVLRRGLAVAVASTGDLGASQAEFLGAAGVAGATAAEAAALRCLEANVALLTGRDANDVARVARDVLEEVVDDSGEAACIAHQTLAVTTGARGDYSAATVHARLSRDLLFGGGIPTRGFLIPEVWEATFLFSIDAFDDALAAYDAARARAERRGELSVLVQTHTAVGFIHYAANRWEDALSEIEAGMTVATETGNHAHDIGCNAMLAGIALSRGDEQRAQAAIEAGECALRSGRHLFGVDLLAWAIARHALANGDSHGARGALEAAWTATEHLRGIVQYRLLGPLLCTALVTNGETGGAQAVADRLQSLADIGGAPSSRAAATRARGLAQADAGALSEAVAQYRESPRRVDLAMACEDAAGGLLAAGREGEAVERLDEAATIYLESGAVHDLARVDAALRAAGARRRRRGPAVAPKGWDALSPTERKVVELVAHGLSNPQIASALFISRRTVETHVSHIFRKVGVSSRTQLATAAIARLS